MWVFDTFLSKWQQIEPALKVQGSMAGKKIRKQFEPRLAHTAVIIDSFVVVFGGLNSQKNSLISNDIYVLCLEANTERIIPSITERKDHFKRKNKFLPELKAPLPILSKQPSFNQKADSTPAPDAVFFRDTKDA